MDNIYFKNPGKPGDIVKIFSKINNIKNSSIEIFVKAIASHPITKNEKEIITCKITFVCLDADRKVMPYFVKTNIGKKLKKSLNF